MITAFTKKQILPGRPFAQAYYESSGDVVWGVTSTSLVAFDTNASAPAIFIEEQSSDIIIDTTDDDLPNIVFSELPKGAYMVQVNFLAASSVGTDLRYAIYDGTDIRGKTAVDTTSGSLPLTVNAVFVHDGGAKTFSMFGANPGAIECRILLHDSRNRRLEWYVYKIN